MRPRDYSKLLIQTHGYDNALLLAGNMKATAKNLPDYNDLLNIDNRYNESFWKQVYFIVKKEKNNVT